MSDQHIETEEEKGRRVFGEWLKAQIAESGRLNKEIAGEVGITPVQLSRILKGISGTSKETLLALAKALKLSPNEVFTRANWYRFEETSAERPPEPEIDDEEFASYVEKALNVINSLPKSQRHRLLDTLNLIYGKETMNRQAGENLPDLAPNKTAELNRVQDAIKEGVELKPIELEPLETSSDPADQEPFKKPKTKPASRLKVIFGPTRRLQG